MDNDKIGNSQGVGDRDSQQKKSRYGIDLKRCNDGDHTLCKLHFLLFNSFDQHWKDNCYIVTCLKLLDLLAYAMIVALLPELKWILEAKYGKMATSQVPKWSKPMVWILATNTYWDLKEDASTIKALRC